MFIYATLYFICRYERNFQRLDNILLNHYLILQADQFVEKFLLEDKPFDDMKAQVIRFKELADDIVYNSRKVIRLGMFELHCDELIRALSKRADSLCAKILIKMSKTNMDLNKG